MKIGEVNYGIKPEAPSASINKNEIAQLQRQKEMLQKQLDTVQRKQKGNEEEQKVTEKQIEQLKKKIAEIDQQIQKLSQQQQQAQEASGEHSPQKAAGTQEHRAAEMGALDNRLQRKQQEDEEKKKKEINPPFDATGEWIDRYV